MKIRSSFFFHQWIYIHIKMYTNSTIWEYTVNFVGQEILRRRSRRQNEAQTINKIKGRKSQQFSKLYRKPSFKDQILLILWHGDVLFYEQDSFKMERKKFPTPRTRLQLQIVYLVIAHKCSWNYLRHINFYSLYFFTFLFAPVFTGK